MISLPFSSFKINQLYFCFLIASCVSCNQTSSFKDYGVISSEIGYVPTIDTTNNSVRPVTLISRLYQLTNKSTDHKIDFVCKASLKYKGGVLSEKREEHIVAPQETINLNIDSNNNRKVFKYEIVSAGIVNE
jgi:hypothetical protein